MNPFLWIFPAFGILAALAWIWFLVDQLLEWFAELILNVFRALHGLPMQAPPKLSIRRSVRNFLALFRHHR